jgi:kynurenine 3-monooxygenase
LVITSRGLRACDAIGGGLREEILSLAVAVVGRVIHQQDGSVQFQRYGKDDTECNYSTSRCDSPQANILITTYLTTNILTL